MRLVSIMIDGPEVGTCYQVGYFGPAAIPPLFFPLLLRYLSCSYPLIVPLTAVSEGARPDRTDVLDTGHIFHHTARITIIADQDIAIIGTIYVHSKARPFFPPYLDVY